MMPAGQLSANATASSSLLRWA